MPYWEWFFFRELTNIDDINKSVNASVGWAADRQDIRIPGDNCGIRIHTKLLPCSYGCP